MHFPAERDNGRIEQRAPWFALHTRYQHETMVARNLRGKGIDVFLPTYEEVHRWSDRKKLVTLPLFPGYLFFADEFDRWPQVVSTPGVHAVLKTGSAPAEVPNADIIAIRQMLDSSRRVEPHPFLSEGDVVRVSDGPLMGLQGIVSRRKDALRLVLSIQILGQAAAVEIDGCAVERVGPFRSAWPQGRNQNRN